MQNLYPEHQGPRRIPITVVSVKPLKKNKFQVKVKETEHKLDNLTHNGVRYSVIKAMTRGRYIMEKVGDAL